jgi:hypothetical protein
MFGQDRDSLRRFFLSSWEKHQTGAGLAPLEKMVAGIVAQHPEYHRLLADADSALASDYDPEGGHTNPFLHMAMHITLAEQLGSDRPTGLRPLYQRIAAACGDPHDAEHRMMECLGLTLWEAQRAGRQPDEQAYLACLEKLARSLTA